MKSFVEENAKVIIIITVTANPIVQEVLLSKAWCGLQRGTLVIIIIIRIINRLAAFAASRRAKWGYEMSVGRSVGRVDVQVRSALQLSRRSKRQQSSKYAHAHAG